MVRFSKQLNDECNQLRFKSSQELESRLSRLISKLFYPIYEPMQANCDLLLIFIFEKIEMFLNNKENFTQTLSKFFLINLIVDFTRLSIIIKLVLLISLSEDRY
jgi:hypothetical protein